RRYGIDAEACLLGVPPVDPEFRRAPAAAPTFLFVARLSREKGADVLLRAFARLSASAPEAELRLAGDGGERPRLEALAASLGIAGRVHVLGEIEPARLDEELACAWALVAPSRWAEPLGLIAVDALVRGVPVVASAVGGFGETVTPGEDGILVANGDERALAEA
ncbi:glycosyltransferase, partial [Escherichia coli]|uniref:glycosyltransferase n=1 Tax=Escherichia coli TaxID=562 RepID=UPI0023B033AA